VNAARPRVLVVDEDQALRLLFRINLELEGFEVVEATSGTAPRSGDRSFAAVVVDDPRTALLVRRLHTPVVVVGARYGGFDPLTFGRHVRVAAVSTASGARPRGGAGRATG